MEFLLVDSEEVKEGHDIISAFQVLKQSVKKRKINLFTLWNVNINHIFGANSNVK